MHKWGHSVYLSPAYRRGYVEVMKALEDAEEEEIRKIPPHVLDFIKTHQDLNYVYEAEDSVLDMSWEGFKVLDMINRYFWCTEEEREADDQNSIDIKRKTILRRLEIIREKTADYIRNCGEKGIPFQGMKPEKLKKYSMGCAQALGVLDGLPPQYTQRIPKEYIWVMQMCAQKGCQYSFDLEKSEGTEGILREKEKLAEETVEIFADIEFRYWKGYQILPEEIEVKLYNIPYEE